MSNLFSYDNPIISGLNKCADCILLSLFWFVFSLPIFTFGAATTALYYTVNKVIRHNRSHVWREFWGSFKSNFKQSTLISLILFVLFVIVGADYFCVLKVAPKSLQIIAAVFLAIINMLLVWSIYLFTYVARFVCTIKVAFKNTFLIMTINLLWSILLWIILIVVVIAMSVIPLAIFIVPTVGTLLMNLILERVYKKYMSPEDLEKEKELNQEYFD